MKRFALSLSLLLTLPVVACGDDGGNEPADDAQVDTSADTTDTSTDDTMTTNPPEDTTTTNPPEDTNTPPEDTNTVTPGCDQSGFTEAAASFGEQQGIFLYQAASAQAEPADILQFEIYPGEQFGGATSAGTYDLTGTNYATCGNCVLVRTQCSQASGCDKTFYADTGSLVISEWAEGGKFSGRLDGVTLKEVTIDSNTFQSTPVVGGQTWCLDGYTFDVDVAAPPEVPMATEPAALERVEAGNGDLLGNNIANFSLPNCNGDMVALHDSPATTKAMWLMGTAGWCTACEAFLQQFVADHGGSLSREIITAQTPGLDMYIILAENQQSALPTADYCTAYAEAKNIDPAMVLIDNNPAGSQIALTMAPGFGLDVNGMATTWTAMNPYLEVSGETVTTGFPWNALLRGSNMEYVWIDTVSPADFNSAIGGLLAE